MGAADDISDLLRDSFAAIRAVSGVEVERRAAEYSIDIVVCDFSEQIRHQIYRKERELMKRFPEVSFRFQILDESPEYAFASDTAESR